MILEHPTKPPRPGPAHHVNNHGGLKRIPDIIYPARGGTVTEETLTHAISAASLRGRSPWPALKVNKKETPIERVFEFNGKHYQTDDDGFLFDSDQWDEDFARGMAPATGICAPLSSSHWSVITLIRNSLIVTGRCPKVYDICKACRLRILDMKQLFPAGYLRGACKLAGLSCSDWVIRSSSPDGHGLRRVSSSLRDRVYRVDITGFLVDPSEWDEEYAICKAEEMHMPRELTDAHWQIIGFLRDRFEKDGQIPTVYDTCEANGMTVEDLEALFPDGYRRGAVKLAGLPSR